MNFFISEFGLFQYFTALCFFLIFPLITVYSPFKHSFVNCLIGTGAVFLAIDEIFMVHECLKITFFRGVHTAEMRDIVILLYSAIGMSLVLYLTYEFWKRLNLKNSCTLIVATGSLLVVVLNDVFGLFPKWPGEILEEVGEVLFAVSLLLFFVGASKSSFRLKSFVTYLLIGVFVGAVILFVVEQSVPQVCVDLRKV